MATPGVAFVHIPKTGGTTISTMLHGKRMGHQRASEVDGRFRFTFVRNPYGRIESAWRWRKEGFDGGVSKMEIARDYAPDRMAEWIVERIEADDFMLRPMVYWLDAPVDFIGRFEQFERDVRIAVERCGVPVTDVPVCNATSGRAAMDERARAVVRRHYAEDFKRFGYET